MKLRFRNLKICYLTQLWELCISDNKAIDRLSCAFYAITTPYINVDQCSSRPGQSLFSGTGHGMIINYVGLPITAEFSDLFCPTSTSTVSSKSAQTKSKKIVSNWHAIIVSLTNSMSSLQSWMKTCRKYLIILWCSHKLCKFCVNGRSAIAFLISFTIHYVYIIRSTMLVIIVFSYPPPPPPFFFLSVFNRFLIVFYYLIPPSSGPPRVVSFKFSKILFNPVAGSVGLLLAPLGIIGLFFLMLRPCTNKKKVTHLF